MAKQQPTTIAQYIAAAPAQGQPLLRELYALLRQAAPHAQETIKWNTPFFVEPGFLFAFSAHKTHCSFAPVAAAFEQFHTELAAHVTTKGTLRLPYDQPLPKELVRKLADHCVRAVAARQDDSFW